MLELLAPTGDMAALEAAINSGADAVYLGLDSFNARMKAQNFNADNIGAVVSRAHFYGVRVYVTINTILQNNEFNELISLVKAAVDAKVDAFLIQDLGVARVLRECFDGITMHASTQLGVHNLYGAKIAQGLGFKRVVLSRETRLEDIREIRDNTDLELEYFVQGALCVAFSGNCYFSSIEQGASGNRGLCKQLCRLPYRAELQGKSYNGHLLSARDLCLFNSVKQLADAGVTSFKLEGRLRREGYVACAVQTYRRAIDAAEAGRSMAIDRKTLDELKTAYSRGEYLERAYLDGGNPGVIEKRFNNHTGIPIGSVLSVREFKTELYEAVLSVRHTLGRGDGLKLFDNDKEMASLGIGDVRELGGGKYSLVTKAKLKKGWQVRLITDASLDKELLSKRRSVPIELSVSARAGEALSIIARCKQGGRETIVQKASLQPLERAINAPIEADDIATACSKMADSGFEVAKCSVDTNGVFIAKSALNALRRELIDELKSKIIELNSPSEVRINEGRLKELACELGKGVELKGKGLKVIYGEDFSGVYLERGEKIILKPDVYSVTGIKRAIELLDIDEQSVILDLPLFAYGEEVRQIERVLSELKITTLVSNNIYGFYFADKGYRVIAGQGHNIANIMAEAAARELGASAYAPSLEYPDFLAGNMLERVVPDKSIPLMTLVHCPYKTIFENTCDRCSYKLGLTICREKRRYAVRRVRVVGCRFELYPQK